MKEGTDRLPSSSLWCDSLTPLDFARLCMRAMTRRRRREANVREVERGQFIRLCTYLFESKTEKKGKMGIWLPQISPPAMDRYASCMGREVKAQRGCRVQAGPGVIDPKEIFSVTAKRSLPPPPISNPIQCCTSLTTNFARCPDHVELLPGKKINAPNH